MTRLQEMKANLAWAYDAGCNCKMCQWVRAYRTDIEELIKKEEKSGDS